MPFPDPDDKPGTLVEAVEFWIVGALMAGAVIAPLYYGLTALARSMGLLPPA